MNLINKNRFQHSPLGAGGISGGMNYYSLNHQSPKVSFAEAALRGQAPDKGLYFPESIPTLPADFIKNIKHYSKEEIGFKVMKPYVGGSIPDDVLQIMHTSSAYCPT